MTGMTLQRGESRRISSISISRRLEIKLADTKNDQTALNKQPVPCRGNEVQQGVNSVVSEARIALYSGLLRQNVIILAFEISDYLLKARSKIKKFKQQKSMECSRVLIVNIISEARRINNRQSNTYTVLLKF